MKDNEIKITRLTAKSLAKVLDDLVTRSEYKSTYTETISSYKEGLKTLVNILKELN